MAAGTATRGRRVALPSAEPPVAEGGAPVYVVNNRPLRFREHILPKDVEVPGAADWTRVEAWVSARQIRRVFPGEEYVTYEQFTGMTLEDEMAAQEVERLEQELAAEAEAQRASQAAKELAEAQEQSEPEE